MKRIGLRAAGRLAGCNHAHIARLAASGQLPRGQDGLFDSADVLRVKAQADPALVRKQPRDGARKVVTPAGDSPVTPSAGSPPPVTTSEDAREAVRLVKQVLAEEGAPHEGPIDYPAARLAETILKARDRALKIAERRRKLVNLEAVQKHAVTFFIGVRRAVQAMPNRHVPEMGAKLGVDPGLLQAELDRMIHATLTEMSAPVLRG